MISLLRRSLVPVALALVAGFAFAASAQDTQRLRGTVESVQGSTYTVKARNGDTVKLVLDEPPLVVAIVKASMADLKPGMFVGATALPDADGSLRAVEVHIFPEAMRGAGEGHRPWDLAPQATMTNANVETAVASVSGRTLKLKYKDGEKTLQVTPQTVVVTYAPGDLAEIKPGTGLFVGAARVAADGSLHTQRLSYGRDGLMPPM